MESELQALTLELTERLTVVEQALKTPFNLKLMVHQFKLKYPELDAARCNIYIGDLHDELRIEAAEAGMVIEGIPVSLIPGALGATVLPPDYAREQATVGLKGKK